MIVVRHLPVIGASRTIITAIVAGIAGVVERAQICTITTRIDGNWRRRRQRGMRMLLLPQQMRLLLVYVVLVVLREKQIIVFVVLRSESAVLVGVLGLYVAREAAQERV